MNTINGLSYKALLDENTRLRAESTAKDAQIAALMERVALLEERLSQNSQNSSKPPSQDPPTNKRPPKPPTGRKRGGQPGHTGSTREMLPLERVDTVVDVKPESCHGCGHHLEGEDANPWRHQVAEIPEIRPHVTEYRLHALTCPHCGEKNYSSLPAEAPTGAFGVRLQAVVAVLTGAYRLSRRATKSILLDLFGVEMALGSVSACEKTASASLAEPVAEAQEYVQQSAVVHVDETGWREGKKRAWLWTATTVLVTVFMIHGKRGVDAARALLGSFAGILVSDRWHAYNNWALTMRQVCWAHLRRDFKALSEKAGVAGEIGKRLFSTSNEIFSLWHRLRDGELVREEFRSRMIPLMASVLDDLEQGCSCPDAKAAGKFRTIRKVWPALWTFVHVPGVEPTNNAAERAVRPAVLWRKGCFGTDSAKGSRFAERMLAAAATCRQQKRNVLQFVVACLDAHIHGRTAPSLLPENTTSLTVAA